MDTTHEKTILAILHKFYVTWTILVVTMSAFTILLLDNYSLKQAALSAIESEGFAAGIIQRCLGEGYLPQTPNWPKETLAPYLITDYLLSFLYKKETFCMQLESAWWKGWESAWRLGTDRKDNSVRNSGNGTEEAAPESRAD